MIDENVFPKWWIVEDATLARKLEAKNVALFSGYYS